MEGGVGVRWAEGALRQSPSVPLWNEARYGGELTRLLASSEFRSVKRRDDAPPVLLIPGFMAGDSSLRVLRRWLMRRGHHVHMSGIRANVGCADALVRRLDEQLQALASETERRVYLIGQSRGGVLARSLAVRRADAVLGLAMLGSPVNDGLAVSPHVLRAARMVATLGDLGVPGVLSTQCKDGACCADFRAELAAPLPRGTPATAMYSYTDGIVDWQACVDPHAEPVNVDSSHCGMSVNLNVYRALDRALDAAAAPPARRRKATGRRRP
jgi:triacylglycerol lipase